MKVWEIDVMVTVVKTLVVTGPNDEDAARDAVIEAFAEGHWRGLAKFAQRGMAAPTPVEELMGKPTIISFLDITRAEVGR